MFALSIYDTLTPGANCDTVVDADLDEDRLRLVRADTLHSAVESLKKYVEDPSVELPRCAS
jgi:hypothetical protein